jgi:hypothetical protein
LNPVLVDDFMVTDPANLIGLAKYPKTDVKGNDFFLFNRSSLAQDANIDGTLTTYVSMRPISRLQIPGGC